MGLPKRRTSRARKLKRRASTWKLKTPTLSTCGKCHSPKLPHRVCSNCGTYSGREVVAAEAE